MQGLQKKKESVWTQIVKKKIFNQRSLMERYGLRDSELLKKYEEEVAPDDETNRESVAAKVYFKSFFGSDFTREEPSPINSALNYGYIVLCSLMSREIVAHGFLTQIGLHHDNLYNGFNLSCDFMEPFRPFVDDQVLKIHPETFETSEKHELLDFVNKTVSIGGRKEVLLNAVSIYVDSVIECLMGTSETIKFPEFVESDEL